jgi:integrase
MLRAGNPRHITLGQVVKRYAECGGAFKVRVEDLAAAALHGHSPTDDTSRWLSSLEDRLYAKLAAVGLAPERQSATIGTLVERYIAERKDDLKPESTRKLRQTETKLLAFFDKDKSLRKITTEDATAWRRSLKDLGLSEAAIRTHCGNVKTMLGEAKRRKVIDTNPFDTLKSGPTPSKYTRYITPDEIQRVIDACPDAEWRLLFGLARYAGLRIPSESHRLTWADVDFERARLTVHSPKTERWEGHDQRVVPITPKLMTLLRERFETMPEGETPLVTIGGKGAVIRRVRRIWAKASVEPWARLWQTLRSSCEKEWAMTFPQFAVSRWIGHSITISGKHYANAVPDELFERAAKTPRPARSARRSGRRRMGPETSRNREMTRIARSAELRSQLSRWAGLAARFRKSRCFRRMEPGGIEPPSTRGISGRIRRFRRARSARRSAGRTGGQTERRTGANGRPDAGRSPAHVAAGRRGRPRPARRRPGPSRGGVGQPAPQRACRDRCGARHGHARPLTQPDARQN